MSNYESVVLAVLENGSVTIETPVCYTSLRRGLDKVIAIINDSAELMGDDGIKGDITIHQLGKGAKGRVYKIAHYPDGAPVPEAFKPKFEFTIVGESDNGGESGDEV